MADSPPVLPGSSSNAGEVLRQVWRGSLTRPGTAAGLGTAGAADVTAAAVWAALAPADPHQEEEQERPQDHQTHKDPLWKTRGESEILTGLHLLWKRTSATSSQGRAQGQNNR